MSDKDDKDLEKGKVLSFPDGKKVNTSEVNTPYVLAEVGKVYTAELQDHESIAKDVIERTNYVKNQELVKVINRGSSTSDIIDVLLKEVAEELGHIKFDRRRAAQEGRQTSNYSVARISALRNMSEMLLKKKEASIAEKLDLNSPRFQKIFKSMMEFFHECMEKSGV